MTDEPAFQEALRHGLTSLGLHLSTDQTQRLSAHFLRLHEANQHTNLTRIVNPQQAAIRHYTDSLALAAWLQRFNLQPQPQTLLDLGTGAGFPAIPLAIALPELDITAVDATAKKIRFVQEAAQHLGLTNLRAIQAHSHHWSTPDRFDLITSRAFAALDVVLTESAKFLSPQGVIVAFKAETLDNEERRRAGNTQRSLNLIELDRFVYELPGAHEKTRFALLCYKRA